MVHANSAHTKLDVYRQRKPLPVANAPSIDVFPAYDEQPGPSSDDYIKYSEYPAEAYF